MSDTVHAPPPRTSSMLGRSWVRYRDVSQGTKILIFMVIGIVAGLIFGERAQVVEPVGELFIRLLVLAAVPLVFANLLAGLTGLEDVRLLGRVGGQFVGYFISTTVIALLLGIAAMEVLRPGVGLGLRGAGGGDVGAPPSLAGFLFDLVPENIFAAFAEGKVSQVIVFALLLGIAALFMPIDTRRSINRGFLILDELLRKLVELIMRLAPFGIGALAASAVGQFGQEMFGPLLLFIGGVWVAQLVMAGVFLGSLVLFTRVSPIAFLRTTAPLYATAAATCSSLASLAVALRMAEERLRLPRAVYSFTLPLGAQLSKEGTAVMLAAVLVFTAQAAGIRFEPSSYPAVIVIGLLLSGASGGIPGGGLVKALIFVQAFNLPLEIAAVVGGIYRLIDIGNTTVNVLGDIVGTQIVARLEQERGAPGEAA